MAFFRRDGGEIKPAGVHTRADGTTERMSVTAAAVPINLGDAASWQMFKLGDHRWQWEAWRHYDICGEMRFVVNWIGNAVSRCRMYVAEISDTGVPGDEAADPNIQIIAETMFGSPASKAEAQRLMGINMMIAGDCFIIAEGVADAKTDVWYVASSSEVFRRGDDIMVKRSITHGGGTYKLDEKKDLLIRAWSPHPRRYDAADSTVRAVLPVLREIEQSTKRIFAEIDSRLAGAGLLPLPQGIDFPRGDGDATGVEGFAALLQRTMATSLQDRQSAAALAPIIFTVPDEFLGKIQPIMFDSKISEQITTLREKAVTRLAMSLDIPPEVLTGTGSSNHWSAWQIEESSIKIHIEPLLIRLADALNIGYLQPALKAAGIADPEKYTLWFDISPLAVRPNRSDQALQFNEKGLISDEAARLNAAFEEDTAPTDEERNRKFIAQLVLAQPMLIGDPEVQKILGLPKISVPPPAAPPQPAIGPDGYPLPPGEPADQGGIPQLPIDNGQGDQGQVASIASRGWDSLFFVADAAVRRALELAGGRLVPGRDRDRYGNVPRHELHTRVLAEESRVPSLLAGAWTHLPEQARMLGTDALALERLLEGYCAALLTRGHAHEPALLDATLKMAMRGRRVAAG